jgi:hypothetical protein
MTVSVCFWSKSLDRTEPKMRMNLERNRESSLVRRRAPPDDWSSGRPSRLRPVWFRHLQSIPTRRARFPTLNVQCLTFNVYRSMLSFQLLNLNFQPFCFIINFNLIQIMKDGTGGRLTKIHLIKIVIFQLIESFYNELIHIWSLDWIFWDFSVDQNFKITQNDINKSFNQLPKNDLQILAVDQKF